MLTSCSIANPAFTSRNLSYMTIPASAYPRGRSCCERRAYAVGCTPRRLRGRVARPLFSAGFMLACIAAAADFPLHWSQHRPAGLANAAGTKVARHPRNRCLDCGRPGCDLGHYRLACGCFCEWGAARPPNRCSCRDAEDVNLARTTLTSGSYARRTLGGFERHACCLGVPPSALLAMTRCIAPTSWPGRQAGLL